MTDRIQALIRQILLNEPTIEHQIQTRIYDYVIPNNPTLPCITIHRITETLDRHTLQRTTRLQIDTYTYNHLTAATLAEDIQRTLTNRQITAGTLCIQTIIPQTMQDLYTPDTRVHRITNDYQITWHNTTDY